MLSVKCPECLVDLRCKDKYLFHHLLNRLVHHLIFGHNLRADAAYEKARNAVRGNQRKEDR